MSAPRLEVETTRLVVTGARGFLGTNFSQRFRADPTFEVTEVTRADSWPEAAAKLAAADFVFHFAGVNRVAADSEFEVGNVQLTDQLCTELQLTGNAAPVVLASSRQATDGLNAYAESKRAAERIVATYAAETGAQAWIARLPNLFGPWARPNYNSVVATYCYNLSRSLPIEVREPDRMLELAFVDDAVSVLAACLSVEPGQPGGVSWLAVEPTYPIRLDDLARLIASFAAPAPPPPRTRGIHPALVEKLQATYRWYARDAHLFAG